MRLDSFVLRVISMWTFAMHGRSLGGSGVTYIDTYVEVLDALEICIEGRVIPAYGR